MLRAGDAGRLPCADCRVLIETEAGVRVGLTVDVDRIGILLPARVQVGDSNFQAPELASSAAVPRRARFAGTLVQHEECGIGLDEG